ncbi:hypothetical protein DERP_007610 [Dermatophagoides pteronyssinus]|uniref:Uncharacterized protein n=1 Tax=Dermatophagoides pteronyssinus TaxID=6956 RepID=A0ABQ8JKQ3_DERPT|nr:hypothetical protein DERP_007610 [Dermatophagoides pteronyssinus]
MAYSNNIIMKNNTSINDEDFARAMMIDKKNIRDYISFNSQSFFCVLLCIQPKELYSRLTMTMRKREKKSCPRTKNKN